MTLAASLYAACAAVVPEIVGMSIGRRNDRATWRVQLGDGASVEDLAAAQATVQSVIDAFVPPDETPRRLVERAVIVERLIAAGKLAAARQALDAASIEMRERWNTKSAIYADDPDALALLKLIGADPATIMAP